MFGGHVGTVTAHVYGLNEHPESFPCMTADSLVQINTTQLSLNY